VQSGKSSGLNKISGEELKTDHVPTADRWYPRVKMIWNNSALENLPT
jgi:hypothetical protein